MLEKFSSIVHNQKSECSNQKVEFFRIKKILKSLDFLILLLATSLSTINYQPFDYAQGIAVNCQLSTIF
ncbi:MAG: hypothetical protein ACRC62_18710 [Microcoleus sp.]